MSSYSLIQKHLDGVSRSFAFCIKELKSPFRDEVGLSYLLFRVIDTIEDYSWPSPKAQNAAYTLFLDSFLELEELPSDWMKSFPDNINKAEKALIYDINKLFDFAKNVEMEKRKLIHQHLENMVQGMSYFAQHSQTNSLIRSLSDFNTYCFFVAGIVGELLSQIYRFHQPSFDQESNKLKSIHFGLFLQKINILKDQLEDASERRFWIHDRPEVLSSLQENSHSAFEYILDLPKNDDGYRLFCAWSYFLGLASLPYIEESWKKQKFVKIPKLKALNLIQEIKKNINSDAYLEKTRKNYEERLSEPLHWESSNVKTMPLPIKYTGSIKNKEFQELKIALSSRL